jgi:hypothetical protein
MAITYRFNRREEDPNEETTPERNERLYGARIPNVKDKRAIDESNERRRIYEEAVAGGASKQEAERAVRGSGVGEIAPNIERQKYEQYLREQDPTSGAYLVKMREQNKLREKLAADIDKSVSFGEKSALRTAAGYERALTRARAAGFSQEELDDRINKAAAVQAKQQEREYSEDELAALRGEPTAAEAARMGGVAAATPPITPAVGIPPMLRRPEEKSLPAPKPPESKEGLTIEAVRPRNVASDALKTFGVLAAERTGLLNTYDLIRSPFDALSAYQRAAEGEAAAKTAQLRKEQADRLFEAELAKEGENSLARLRPNWVPRLIDRPIKMGGETVVTLKERESQGDVARRLSPEEREERRRYMLGLRNSIKVK